MLSATRTARSRESSSPKRRSRRFQPWLAMGDRPPELERRLLTRPLFVRNTVPGFAGAYTIENLGLVIPPLPTSRQANTSDGATTFQTQVFAPFGPPLTYQQVGTAHAAVYDSYMDGNGTYTISMEMSAVNTESAPNNFFGAAPPGGQFSITTTAAVGGSYLLADDGSDPSQSPATLQETFTITFNRAVGVGAVGETGDVQFAGVGFAVHWQIPGPIVVFPGAGSITAVSNTSSTGIVQVTVQSTTPEGVLPLMPGGRAIAVGGRLDFQTTMVGGTYSNQDSVIVNYSAHF